MGSPSSPSIFRRFLLWAGVIAVSAIAVLLVFFALLPTLLSTSWGQNLFVSRLNNTIPGEISVKDLSLSWFGSQRIQGVTLHDDQGEFVFHFDDLVAETSLFSLLVGSNQWIPFEINGLDAKFTKDSQGETNLLRSFGLHSTPWNQGKSASLTIHNVHAVLSIRDRSPSGAWSFQVEGTTLDGDKKGTFDVAATFHNNSFPQASALSRDWQQLAQFLEQKGTKISAHVRDFPTLILDRLISHFVPEARGIVREALGETLSFTLVNTAEPNGLQWKGDVQTPYLSGEGTIQLQKDRWVADSPTSIHWTLPSPIAQRLLEKVGASHLTLKNSPRIDFELQRFSLPIKWKPFEVLWSQAVVQGAFNGSPFLFQQGTETFSMEDLAIAIAPGQTDNSLLLSLNGTLVEDEKSAPLKIHGSTSDLGNLYHLFFGTPSTLDFQVETEEFPLPLLDHAFASQGAIVAALGEHFRFFLDLKKEKEKKIEASVHLETAQFSVPDLLFTLNDNLDLAKPLFFQFSLTPELLSHLVSPEIASHVRQNVQVQAALNKFSLPFRQPGDQFWNQLALDFDIASDAVVLSDLDQVGNLRLSDLRVHLSGDGIQKLKSTFWGKIESQNRLGITPDVLGGVVDAYIEGKFGLSSTGRLEMPKIFSSLKSDLAELKVVGSIDDQGHFHFVEPAHGTYLVTNSALIDLGYIQPGQPLLESPAALTLRLTSEEPLSPEIGFDTKTLKGSIDLDELTFRKDSHRIATLTALSIPWELDGPANRFKATINGKTFHEESQTAGAISGEYRLLDWRTNKGELNFANSRSGFHVSLQDFPMVLGNIVTMRDDLVHLFGPLVQATAAYTPPSGSAKEGVLTFQATTPLFSGEGDFLVREGRLRASKEQAFQAKWTVTPEGYSVLRQKLKGMKQQDDSVYLQEPAVVTLQLENFDLPLSKDQSWIQQCAVTAAIAIDNLTVGDLKKRKEVQLDHIEGTVISKNLAQQLDFYLHTQNGADVSFPKPSLLAKGSLLNMWTPEGLLNPYSIKLVADAEAENLPIGLLCNLLFLPPSLQEKTDALLGETADLHLHVDMEELMGNVFAEIEGPNGHVLLDGKIQDGIFTLNQPFEAKVTIHPELSQAVLQDIVPLLGGAQKADHPLTIRIEPENFSFPLLNYSYKRIRMEKAEIVLGKVEFSNEGQLGTVLDILKPVKEDEISVWFTPIYFNFANGILDCQRLDMLVNDLYPIATWGRIDFVQDKVKMVIGLTGTAIEHAFELNNISQNYMLQLDVQGSTRHAKIDKTKATTRISALVAQKHGGAKGKLIGTMLQIAAGDLVDPQPPAPTTYPFPWSPSGDEAFDEIPLSDSSIQEIPDAA